MAEHRTRRPIDPGVLRAALGVPVTVEAVAEHRRIVADVPQSVLDAAVAAQNVPHAAVPGERATVRQALPSIPSTGLAQVIVPFPITFPGSAYTVILTVEDPTGTDIGLIAKVVKREPHQAVIRLIRAVGAPLTGAVLHVVAIAD